MSESPQLATPRLRVWQGDKPPYEVQATNPDMVAWDRTRAKHRWPKTEEAPFLWMTFIAWSASRRNKHIPSDLSYEAFEASTVALEAIDADGNPLQADEAGVAAVPTPEGPEPG